MWFCMEDDVSWRNVCSNGGPFGGLGLVGQGGWPIVRDIFLSESERDWGRVFFPMDHFEDGYFFSFFISILFCQAPKKR